MTSAAQGIRFRRNRRRRAGATAWPRDILLAASVVAVLLAGAVIVAGGRIVFAAAADLPAASSLESTFGPRGEERFRTAQLFDRSGEVLLADVLHPLGRDRQWLRLDRLPEAIEQATIAALDPTFRANPGYEPATAAGVLVRSATGNSTPVVQRTITERLAEQTLAHASRSPLSATLLAADIAAAYPKDRVLEWFLNSADYGNLAFGIDAAARVYLGKSAAEVSLAEAAWLAALPAHPELDPLADPTAASALQRDVLAAMRLQGMITSREEEEAGRTTVSPQGEAAGRSMQGLGFVKVVWDELRSRVGAGAGQAGARVVTTLDLDLQLQADCVARSYEARMAGGDPVSVLPAADGSPCAAASLLPPPRPGDSGVDHQIEAAATVLLDPASGEVMAITGPMGEPRTAGTILSPLIYLSAFSRGYTPATMVIDNDGEAEGAGPVRLRTALAHGDGSVSEQLLSLLGPDVAASTLGLVGLGDAGDGLAQGIAEVVPLRLAAALGILANRGVEAGAASASDDDVTPSTIRAVYTPDGEELYRLRPAKRSVVSEGLAFLVNDILSDEAARVEAFGPGGPLEVGRPAAVVTASTASDSWAFGYTPQVVAGVWLGSGPNQELEGIHELNGAAVIWHALLRYASRELPPLSWPMPADVTEVDVCDPSGYLPTPYCPRVVREVFLSGTEPTHSDTLYRPFRINRETGRLATYFTPLDQVTEVVYFVPPPEAEAWAQAAGWEAPPDEYDRVTVAAADSPDVQIASPSFFGIVSGHVDVTGTADGEDFAAFRVDVGEGLDPRAWLQVGGQQDLPVRGGRLAHWDTTGLSGAAILRLTVIRQDGTVATAALPVTVDNRPPVVEIVLPRDEAVFSVAVDKSVAIQVDASDETLLDRVVIFVDDRPVWTGTEPPWAVAWPLGSAGEHIVRASAYDVAGNWADSEEATISVAR